jgi:outer membrane scaffolding protein for murein synthesis (MipA/OmpV family)
MKLTFIFRGIFRVAIFLTVGALAAPAVQGQVIDPQRIDTQQVPDLPIRSVPSGPPPDSGIRSDVWRVSAGGGLSYAPRYEGASSNSLRVMPLLEAGHGKIFISPLRGIGYNFSDDKNMEYGLRLTLGHGRRQNADPRLNGMGDISYAAETGAYLNLRFSPWYISGGLTAGSHGTHAELGGGIGIPLSTADRLRIGANLNWGDNQYNQTYFGVTPAQATASGNVLTAYNASAGIKDYALTANWAHSYSKEWFSGAGVSFKRLTGSAQYSPLTMRRTMNSLNFLVGYRF